MQSKLGFLYNYTKRYKWWYLGGIASLALTIWASVTIPEYIQKAIDTIILGRDSKDVFLHNVWMIFVFALFLIVVRTMSRSLFLVPGRLVERRLKGDMYKKLISFDKSYFDNNSAGSIISRVNNDINGVRMITGFGFLQIVNILLALSITPYKMIKMSPTLTLYAVVPVIVIFIIVRVGLVIMVKNTKLRMDALQRLSGKIVSFLSGNGVIKSYNIHKWAEDKVEEENVALFGYTLKITWIRSFVMPLLSNMEQLLKIIILFAGGMYVIDGKFTIGQLTEFIAYTALLTHPISGLGWLLSVFQQGFVGINSIQTIMDNSGVDDHLPRIDKEKLRSIAKNGISINNLNYKYHNGNNFALKNINLDIKPNQVVGISGPLGSGKSTLINCINGYLKVDEKSIYFDGKDMATINGKDIRSVVRTVSQDIFLFSDSIENNIAFGQEQLSGDILTNVIYKSALADEIERFPERVKTIVGEKGIMLSGGQKQRISLARALYSAGDILILDDIFSAVDIDTERFLIEQLFNQKIATNIIVVSNRMSVLEKTDFNIVIENGEISAKGTHNELVEKSEFYRETLRVQEGGVE
mgnify:CR=1 FL=1